MNVTTGFDYGDTGFQDAHGSRLASMLARASVWLDERSRRARIVQELRSLTDRDLADIGIARCDVHRVFDPEFVATFRS